MNYLSTESVEVMSKIVIEITGNDTVNIDPDELAGAVFNLLEDDFPQVTVTGYEDINDGCLADRLLKEFELCEDTTCEDNGNSINRQAVLSYIDRILNQGTGKKKSLEFLRKYVEKLRSEKGKVITMTNLEAAIAHIKTRADAWAVKEIEQALSQESARPKGKWIDKAGNEVPFFKGTTQPSKSCWCSNCKEWLTASDEYAVNGAFCPNCGSYNGGDNNGNQ